MDVPGSPRLVLQYDYASGDTDPNDTDNSRFDTLFGARRFKFGPTGIYGPFDRGNINSPGFRIEAKPSMNLVGFIGYRAAWLASRKDELTTGEIRDECGASGRFLGHQLEGRLRYKLFSGSFENEIGGAYLFKGAFLRNAPDTPSSTNVIYFYMQKILKF